MKTLWRGDRVRHADGNAGVVISDELLDYEPIYRVKWDDGGTSDVCSAELDLLHIGVTNLQGVEIPIAAALVDSSAEKTAVAPLSARQEIAVLRTALDLIEALADPQSRIATVARRALKT
ncbi:hypothetical protein HQO42_14915 [Rhodococcus fascians]|nr:hypothetical protein [Rhodococcus fascians]MBY4237746.1 hypothetical protein [Rhodococcus fascians]MBY4253949.1 hypothetical protein [Rhodococcus fascians]MBY4269180.1 hypothetical protein [Rhodococcus fascians]